MCANQCVLLYIIKLQLTVALVATEAKNKDNELINDQQESDEIHHALNGVSPKPWFFREGKRLPLPEQEQQSRPDHDRIIKQLMFVPSNYEQIVKSGKYKTILLAQRFDFGEGKEEFLECPVSTCTFTSSHQAINYADLVVFTYFDASPFTERPPNQLYMLYMLESPYHTSSINRNPDAINWTATYRYVYLLFVCDNNLSNNFLI